MTLPTGAKSSFHRSPPATLQPGGAARRVSRLPPPPGSRRPHTRYAGVISTGKLGLSLAELIRHDRRTELLHWRELLHAQEYGRCFPGFAKEVEGTKVWEVIRSQPRLWSDGYNIFVYHHPEQPGAPISATSPSRSRAHLKLLARCTQQNPSDVRCKATVDQ